MYGTALLIDLRYFRTILRYMAWHGPTSTVGWRYHCAVLALRRVR